MEALARLLTALVVIVVSWSGSDGSSAPVWSSISRPALSHRTRRTRVVMYLRDVARRLDDDQLRQLSDACAGRGYLPVGVVQEEPGQIDGLIDALRMVHDGEADRILMPTHAMLPDLFESATGEHPSPWLRESPDPPGQRRPRRHLKRRPDR